MTARARRWDSARCAPPISGSAVVCSRNRWLFALIVETCSSSAAWASSLVHPAFRATVSRYCRSAASTWACPASGTDSAYFSGGLGASPGVAPAPSPGFAVPAAGVVPAAAPAVGVAPSAGFAGVCAAAAARLGVTEAQLRAALGVP